MTVVLPIAPLAGVAEPAAAAPVAVAPARPGGFAQVLANGVDQVNQKVLDADKLVKAFALDDSIPVHQVTFALEQARLSTELMMQIRSRVLEGYQEILRMQL
jgi:flagellar hook-basal body complex protein FliE